MDPVHSVRSLCKLLSSYRGRDVFKTLSKIKRERFAQRIMLEGTFATRNISGQESGWFVELRHFDKHFVKTQEKEALQGNILKVFLLEKFVHFEWKSQPKDEYKQGFFSKIRTLLSIFKKNREGLPSSLLDVRL